MQVEPTGATACFQRLVDAGQFPSVDACWKRFAQYLAHRTKSYPAGLIGPVSGAWGADLMAALSRCVEKGAACLLDPRQTPDDADARFFRKLDTNSNVRDEAQLFVKWWFESPDEHE